MGDMSPELADVLVAMKASLDAIQERDAALNAALGSLIGMLRIKGILSEDDQEALFAMAEAAMQHCGWPTGTAALGALRTMAENIEGEVRASASQAASNLRDDSSIPRKGCASPDQ